MDSIGNIQNTQSVVEAVIILTVSYQTTMCIAITKNENHPSLECQQIAYCMLKSIFSGLSWQLIAIK